MKLRRLIAIWFAALQVHYGRLARRGRAGPAVVGVVTPLIHMPGDDGAILLYDSAYNQIWTGFAFDGAYSTDAWLPGTYYVEALGESQLSGCAFYLDRPCPDDGGSPADVDPTPVTVAAGETRTGVDFHLPPADAIFTSGFEL